jgi:hypothetical protein
MGEGHVGVERRGVGMSRREALPTIQGLPGHLLGPGGAARKQQATNKLLHEGDALAGDRYIAWAGLHQRIVKRKRLVIAGLSGLCS